MLSYWCRSITPSTLCWYIWAISCSRGSKNLTYCSLTMCGTGKGGLDIWWKGGGQQSQRKGRVQFWKRLDGWFRVFSIQLDVSYLLNDREAEWKYKSVPWVASQWSFCCRSGDNVLCASHTEVLFFQKKKNVQHAQCVLLCRVYKCITPQC